MTKPYRLFISLFVIASSISACYHHADKNSSRIDDLKPTVILISIDGFRWDYFEKAALPNFQSLIKTGVRAKALIPAFPTKTFPSHYQNHRRIAPIIGIADDGWKISSRGRRNTREGFYTTGEHGYDNQLAAMRAIFIAHGPAFKSGLVVEPFQNINIYDLLCRILGLQPAPNDGSIDSVRAMLK